MKTYRFLVLTLVAVQFIGCTASTSASVQATVSDSRSRPQVDAGPFNPKRVAELVDPYYDALDRDRAKTGPLSGFVTAVAGDRVVYARSFGFADRTAKRVPDADTSFRVGSVTKQFTSAAVMTLVEDGKLKLDETIAEVLPAYAGQNPSSTVGQVLRHGSGIPSYTDSSALMKKRGEPHTPAQLVAAVRGVAPTFEPGTGWAYSNTGYVLLGMIIEARAGESYASYVKKRLFDRAGLVRTVLDEATGLPNRAKGYRKDDKGEFISAHPVHPSVPWSAGAVRSTANDLVKWDRALQSGKILSKTSRETWYAPGPHPSPFGPYAMGWLVHSIDDKPVYFHGGGIDGFTTFYIRVPADDVVIVAWINNGTIAAQKVGQPLFDVMYKGALPKPAAKAPIVGLSAWLVDGATGQYSLVPESGEAAKKGGVPPAVIEQIDTLEVTVGVDDQTLVVKPNGQPSVSVSQRDDGTVRNDEEGISIEFKRDGDTATGLILKQGVFTFEYTRK